MSSDDMALSPDYGDEESLTSADAYPTVIEDAEEEVLDTESVHPYPYPIHLLTTSIPKKGALLRYHCTVCGQNFSNKSSLVNHSSDVHTTSDERCYRCASCYKSFPSSQQLTQHMLVHTNVRRYQCEFCDKAFKQLSHVQQHQRIHTGELPYRCPVTSCNRSFRQQSSMKQHLRGHEGPTFSTTSNIILSTKTASPRKKYSRTASAISSSLSPTESEFSVGTPETAAMFTRRDQHPDFLQTIAIGRALSNSPVSCDSTENRRTSSAYLSGESEENSLQDVVVGARRSESDKFVDSSRLLKEEEEEEEEEERETASSVVARWPSSNVGDAKTKTKTPPLLHRQSLIDLSSKLVAIKRRERNLRMTADRLFSIYTAKP